ncbi:MAG: dihydroorotate dehydrogenase (quinone) [Bifidobacteriaceae bacterium]|jgi:dihydroorotate dehydrogenase (fumarate)|nr:dihydroorotate dehydrogenase (quinone) [Bifidobacteriaceae bacterium]
MRTIFRFFTRNGYRFIVKPYLFAKQPDKAHEMMISFAAWAQKVPLMMFLLRFTMKYEKQNLSQKLMGLEFKNPVGFAAGIDKNAEIGFCIEGSGFSFGSFGSITAKKSDGNPKPWYHRLPSYNALLIYAGLPNWGVDKVVYNLEKIYDNTKNFIVAGSLARTNSKEAATDEEGIKDYVYSIKKCRGKIGLIEINISCPNTFHGEPFTDPKRLDKLLTQTDKVTDYAPVTLKMPHDKTLEEFDELCAIAAKHNVQALTIGNLRKNRKHLSIPEEWNGNIAGKPTEHHNNKLITSTYKKWGSRFVIIGLGGIFSPVDAYRKIRAGASLIQIASALMYLGPTIVPDIKKGLEKHLEADGFKSIADAIGVDAK